MLEAQNISFSYPKRNGLFKDLSWKALSGERWAIVGPSGSGKTTFLYLLAGLYKPSSGTLTLNKHSIALPDKRIGLVLQDYGLLPWNTVRQNIEVGLKIRHYKKSARIEKVDEWIVRMGLEDVAYSYPFQISGGQRQRVALARALALHPQVLLMDEPFAALDFLTKNEIQEDLLGYLKEEVVNPIYVHVTHDINEAVAMGEKIVVFGYPPIEKIIVADYSDSSASQTQQLTHYEKTEQIKQFMKYWA